MLRPPPASTRTDTLVPDTTVFRAGVARRVAVVEREDDLAPGAHDGVFDARGAGRVDRERLLHDDVGAGLERADDEVGMQVVARGDDDPVDVLGGDHLLETLGRPGARGGDAAADDLVDVELRAARSEEHTSELQSLMRST